MTRLKYLDPADGLYKLLPVGGGSAAPDEVWIGGAAPTDPNVELWYDTATTNTYAQGPTVVSAEAGNQSRLGSDGFLYTPSGQQALVFADAAARNAGIPSPTEGRTCWLTNIHQHQTYRAAAGSLPAGWYPSGGNMPYGVMLGDANQSLPLNTPAKASLTAASDVQGGITADTANSCFSNLPYGLYLCTTRSYLASHASANSCTVDGGSSTGTYSSVAEYITTANRGGIVHATWYFRVNSSYPTIAVWLTSTVARVSSYRTLTISYVNQWGA